jgi:NADPH-dependent curcumin reductase CurA
MPACEAGKVLLKVKWLEVNPSMRLWLLKDATYVPPMTPGDLMQGRGLCEVLESQDRMRHLQLGTLFLRTAAVNYLLCAMQRRVINCLPGRIQKSTYPP